MECYFILMRFKLKENIMYFVLRYLNFDIVGFFEKEEERKIDLLINV